MPQRTLRHQRQRRLSLLVFVGLLVSMLGTVGFAATQGGLSLAATVDAAVEGKRFSLTDFELQSIFNKWLGEVGAFVTGRRDSGADADRLVTRYFSLRTEIATLEADGARERTEIAELRRERHLLENRAERILESRVADALRSAGIVRTLPLFGGQDLLWPPVDIELTQPPRLLAISPRDEIRLVRDILLDPDLSLAEIVAIEQLVEADGRWSALVDAVGGVAAYPAIVRDSRSYESSINTIAHEWVHHYLFFFPLGQGFFRNNEVRTINETVADIVAAEIDDLVFAASPAVRPTETRNADRTESDEILFQLRFDVDRLLAAGEVDQAERLMDEVRLELTALGRDLRRINQAYFAFNGVYATSAASSSPIGLLLQELRGAAASLADFLAKVRDVTGQTELEALLTQP